MQRANECINKSYFQKTSKPSGQLRHIVRERTERPAEFKKKKRKKTQDETETEKFYFFLIETFCTRFVFF